MEAQEARRSEIVDMDAVFHTALPTGRREVRVGMVRQGARLRRRPCDACAMVRGGAGAVSHINEASSAGGTKTMAAMWYSSSSETLLIFAHRAAWSLQS